MLALNTAFELKEEAVQRKEISYYPGIYHLVDKSRKNPPKVLDKVRDFPFFCD